MVFLKIELVSCFGKVYEERVRQCFPCGSPGQKRESDSLWFDDQYCCVCSREKEKRECAIYKTWVHINICRLSTGGSDSDHRL